MTLRVIHGTAWHPLVPGWDLHVAALEPWRDEALCGEVGWAPFFPETGGSTEAARRVCEACPARDLCLDDALETGDYNGVRGGLSGDERRALGVPVTRPLPVLCDSGRHFARSSRGGCDGCEREAEQERGRTRARDQSGRSAARRAGQARKPAVRTKGIAA